jgi:type II secretory pathway component PulK
MTEVRSVMALARIIIRARTLLQRDALDSPSQTNLAQTWAQEGRRFTLDDGEILAIWLARSGDSPSSASSRTKTSVG